MASLLKPLVKATGLSQKEGQERQAYLINLAKAVAALEDEAWEKIPDDSQEWNNAAIIAIKAGEDVVDPDGEAAPAPKAAKAKKPEPVDEDDEEADDEDEEADEEVDDEDEDEEAPPAKKPVKAKKSEPKKAKKESEAEAKPEKAPRKQTAATGASAVFRKAYILAYLKNPDVKPAQVIEKNGITISKGTSGVISYEARAVIAVLRAKKLLA